MWSPWVPALRGCAASAGMTACGHDLSFRPRLAPGMLWSRTQLEGSGTRGGPAGLAAPLLALPVEKETRGSPRPRQDVQKAASNSGIVHRLTLFAACVRVLRSVPPQDPPKCGVWIRLLQRFSSSLQPPHAPELPASRPIVCLIRFHWLARAFTLACIDPAALNSDQLPSLQGRREDYHPGWQGVGCTCPESAELNTQSC